MFNLIYRCKSWREVTTPPPYFEVGVVEGDWARGCGDVVEGVLPCPLLSQVSLNQIHLCNYTINLSKSKFRKSNWTLQKVPPPEKSPPRNFF